MTIMVDAKISLPKKKKSTRKGEKKKLRWYEVIIQTRMQGSLASLAEAEVLLVYVIVLNNHLQSRWLITRIYATFLSNSFSILTHRK